MALVARETLAIALDALRESHILVNLQDGNARKSLSHVYHQMIEAGICPEKLQVRCNKMKEMEREKLKSFVRGADEDGFFFDLRQLANEMGLTERYVKLFYL